MDPDCLFGVPSIPIDSDCFRELVDIVLGRNNPETVSDECEGSESDLEKLNIYDLPMTALTCYTDGSAPLGERLRRAEFVRRFTDHYEFASGEKICIPPYGPPIICPSSVVKCFESTWVGVYGLQSICMVTCRDMDTTRLPAFYQTDCMKHQNMCDFARAAISEVECLPHDDVDNYDVAFRRCCTGLAKEPFAVVSLGPDTREECGDKLQQDWKPIRRCVPQTITYLESVVSSDLLHTHYGIIRVAVRAYQLMCRKELRADDIWVTIMNVSSGRFDDLPMDIIGEQLDLVHSLSSEKEPQKLSLHASL